MRRLRSANSTEAARLSSAPILRTSHLRSTTWTSSPNTLRQKVIHCRTDHIRRTAEELPSLTHRKVTRSNLSSEVRNNILHVILPGVGVPRHAAQALARATVLSIIFRP